ncbi:MAG: hypothetical protein OES24_09480 [Acidimicrobiia bacterium]|nr:hypothetical protein [Acidimicrobiia bacterium]
MPSIDNSTGIGLLPAAAWMAGASRYLEVPDADGVAMLSSVAAGLGGGRSDEETSASAGDLAAGMPGGLVGLAGLINGVGLVGAAGGLVVSRRRFRRPWRGFVSAV